MIFEVEKLYFDIEFFENENLEYLYVVKAKSRSFIVNKKYINIENMDMLWQFIDGLYDSIRL